MGSKLAQKDDSHGVPQEHDMAAIVSASNDSDLQAVVRVLFLLAQGVEDVARSYTFDLKRSAPMPYSPNKLDKPFASVGK